MANGYFRRMMRRRCGAPEPLSERHVQALWYDRDLRPENMETRQGERIRVVHPGEWNLEAGPDFRNAVLEIGDDRRRVVGDVEIHLSPSDWDAHGHASDPEYKNVVAHVTWMCGPDPATLPARAVTVWIGRYMTSRIGFSPDQIDLGAYPFSRLPLPDRPCRECFGSRPDLAAEMLAAAGEHRIHAKARRVRALLRERGGLREQVFYEELMSAMGYKHNSRNFRRIAEAVPYEAIAAEPENAPSAFLSAAGFVGWVRSGVRPWNSPERRLAAVAEMFMRGSVMYLADVASFSPEAARAMVKTLVRGGTMGRGRAAAIVANVVLPFALAEGRVDSVPDWLPPEDVSLPVRLTAFRMFGRDHNPAAHYANNGLLIQGLIQVHRDFCLQVHPDCGECALASDFSRKGEIACSQSATAAR